MLGLFLTFVWFFIVIYFSSKYLQELNSIIYFSITIVLLLVGDAIIERLNPNKES